VHHHVNGFVGAKKIQHANDVRVIDRSQGPAFLEEALQADPVGIQVLGRDVRKEFAGLALGQRRRHVLLDRDRLAVLVLCKIDDRESTARYLLYNPITAELHALGQ
jgi:hypothetical protein